LILQGSPAKVSAIARFPGEEEREGGKAMKLRNLIRSVICFVAVLICSTWMLASSRVWLNVDDPPQFSDWSAAVNLGPIVNSSVNDQAPVISPDGLSLYFGSQRPGGFGGVDIYVSQRASVLDPWGPPQNLGPNINTPFIDNGPALSRDGHRLFFQSMRPGGFGGNDLYVSRRHNKRDDFGWQPAENLGSGVNSFAAETKSEYFEDDETGTITLYFRSDRPGGLGGDDIYASTLQPDETFGAAVLVEAFSSIYGDFSVTLRRDGLEAIVSSNRSDMAKLGGSDLWVFSRVSTADSWSSPTNLGANVNSPSEEVAATLSFDRTALYFFSNRPGTLGGFDLYVSTRAKLNKPD
jgi:hypothetical protein